VPLVNEKEEITEQSETRIHQMNRADLFDSNYNLKMYSKRHKLRSFLSAGANIGLSNRIRNRSNEMQNGV
jgi:hypothetical protein